MVVRQMGPDDQGYVLRTWVDSLYHSREDLQAYTSLEGFQGLAMLPHRRALQRLDVLVLEVDGVLIGWVAYSRMALWYVYVAKPWRGKGLASRLVRALPSTPQLVACVTPSWVQWAGHSLLGPWRWEPKLWAVVY